MIKKLESILLNWLLKDTWHLCNHDFECKMASVDGKYQEYKCKKCNVTATNEFRERLIIMVDEETNSPYRIGEVTGYGSCKGIFVNNK